MSSDIFEDSMKTYEHPIFLITSLCLFFPIGLVLLILSDHPAKKKLLMAITGGLIFAALLTTVCIGMPKTVEITELELAITKDQLTIGQSGGFSVHSSGSLITDFKATASNDSIRINENVYTAIKEGSATIHITAGDIETSFIVTVVEGTATDSIVYLSPTGSRYHDTLTHAGKNTIKMTEEEALRSGKTPCKICYKQKADG